MARQLVGKKYKDMPERYRDRVSKNEFQGRRKAQQMAGERMKTRQDVAQGYGQLSPEKQEEYGSRQEFRDTRREFNNENPYAVDKLENFDLRATGAGGAQGRGAEGLDTAETADDKLGRGKARLSREDLLGLQEQGGFDKQELIDFAETKVTRDFGEGTGGYGGAAAGLLEKWKTEIMKAEAAENSNINPKPPGTKPGVDEIPDDTNDGGNIADAPSIPAPLPAGGIGNIIGDTGDISLQDSTIFGDLNTGTINDVRVFGDSMGAGGTNAYGSALAQSEAYKQAGEDTFEDVSGRNYGLTTSAMFDQRATENNPVPYMHLLDTAMQYPGDLMSMSNAFDLKLYGEQSRRATGNQPFIMAKEPFEDQSNPDDLLKFT